MDKNIEIKFKNGEPDLYIANYSSEKLKVGSFSFAFKTEEEAELAIAIAKTLKVYKKEEPNMCSVIRYVWRTLGLFETDWA